MSRKPDVRSVRSTARRNDTDVSWVVVVWGLIVVGLALATVGGVAFGHAWTNEGTPMWWVGAITLLTGLLLVLSGLYMRSHPRGVAPEVGVRGEPTDTGEPVVPLLGAILVYQFRWVTQQQLNRALEQQRSEGRDKRRIGEILLDLEMITQAQLQEALDRQDSLLRDKHAAKA
ncbi:MAG: hypothetical protein JXA57_06165 [Armatimonadetes bacterium]|nr:hypothetical protein [Armatimonadota bacterium]